MIRLITTLTFTACCSLLMAQQHLPDNKSFGMKANGNYYFPSYKSTSDTESDFAKANNNGLGIGFYFRYDFTPRYSFQPELLVTTRSGSVTKSDLRQVDSNISIATDTLANIAATSFEVPLYFKARFEIIPTYKGHYKANKALGILIGPRVSVNAISKKQISTRELSTLYTQESELIQNESESNASDYLNTVNVGITIGADVELINRLTFYANYHRGLTSITRKSVGYKMFDNRVEIGLGFRFY